MIRLGVRGMPKHEEGPVEHEKSTPEQTPSKDITDRRDFLKKCGKFAAVTPPAITMLLSTSLTSKAIAKSGGGGGGWWRHKRC